MGDKAVGAAAGGAFHVFIPWVSKGTGPTIPPVGGQQGEGRAKQLFELMCSDPRQGRKPCVWNSRIAAVALARVKSMAHNRWHSHTSPDGRGPDMWLAAAGYNVPTYYLVPKDLNYVESLNYGGGPDVKAETIWGELMDSPDHKKHLLAEINFYAEQTQVGIAFYFLQDSEAGYYCSLITAPPE